MKPATMKVFLLLVLAGLCSADKRHFSASKPRSRFSAPPPPTGPFDNSDNLRTADAANLPDPAGDDASPPPADDCTPFVAVPGAVGRLAAGETPAVCTFPDGSIGVSAGKTPLPPAATAPPLAARAPLAPLTLSADAPSQLAKAVRQLDAMVRMERRLRADAPLPADSAEHLQSLHFMSDADTQREGRRALRDLIVLQLAQNASSTTTRTTTQRGRGNSRSRNGSVRVTVRTRTVAEQRVPGCESEQKVSCDKGSRYRTADGSCNNLKNPSQGRSGSGLTRLLNSTYADGIFSPRLLDSNGVPLPSARALSARLLENAENEDARLALSQVVFAEFLSHDILHTTVFRLDGDRPLDCCATGGSLHPQCLPIAVAVDDPLYGPTGRRCLSVARSLPAPERQCQPRPAAPLSTQTAFLDGSALYGASEEVTKRLRELTGGRLRTNGGLLPPRAAGAGRRRRSAFGGPEADFTRHAPPQPFTSRFHGLAPQVPRFDEGFGPFHGPVGGSAPDSPVHHGGVSQSQVAFSNGFVRTASKIQHPTVDNPRGQALDAFDVFKLVTATGGRDRKKKPSKSSHSHDEKHSPGLFSSGFNGNRRASNSFSSKFDDNIQSPGSFSSDFEDRRFSSDFDENRRFSPDFDDRRFSSDFDEDRRSSSSFSSHFDERPFPSDLDDERRSSSSFSSVSKDRQFSSEFADDGHSSSSFFSASEHQKPPSKHYGAPQGYASPRGKSSYATHKPKSTYGPPKVHDSSERESDNFPSHQSLTSFSSNFDGAGQSSSFPNSRSQIFPGFDDEFDRIFPSSRLVDSSSPTQRGGDFPDAPKFDSRLQGGIPASQPLSHFPQRASEDEPLSHFPERASEDEVEEIFPGRRLADDLASGAVSSRLQADPADGPNRVPSRGLAPPGSSTKPGAADSRSSADDTPPPQATDQSCDAGCRGCTCFDAGSGRANEQPHGALLQTVWLREHNRVAGALADQHPDWNDERLFQEARRIVIAELQHITYNEWVPTTLGYEYSAKRGLLPLASGFSPLYNDSADASPAVEFGTAAFRVGHSKLQGMLQLLSRAGEADTVELATSQFDPSAIVGRDFFVRMARGMIDQPAEGTDRNFDDAVHGGAYTSGSGGGARGLDLPALNVQRGRDQGVATYPAAVELCHGNKLATWDDYSALMEPETVAALREAYAGPADVDLYLGGLLERHAAGADVGPTFQCLIGDMFHRLRVADRFFYDNDGQAGSFEERQLDELRKASLARLLCDNVGGDFDGVQPMAMLRPDQTENPIVTCDSEALPRVDLGVF